MLALGPADRTMGDVNAPHAKQACAACGYQNPAGQRTCGLCGEYVAGSAGGPAAIRIEAERGVPPAPLPEPAAPDSGRVAPAPPPPAMAAPLSLGLEDDASDAPVSMYGAANGDAPATPTETPPAWVPPPPAQPDLEPAPEPEPEIRAVLPKAAATTYPRPAAGGRRVSGHGQATYKYADNPLADPAFKKTLLRRYMRHAVSGFFTVMMVSAAGLFFGPGISAASLFASTVPAAIIGIPLGLIVSRLNGGPGLGVLVGAIMGLVLVFPVALVTYANREMVQLPIVLVCAAAYGAVCGALVGFHIQADN